MPRRKEEGKNENGGVSLHLKGMLALQTTLPPFPPSPSTP